LRRQKLRFTDIALRQSAYLFGRERKPGSAAFLRESVGAAEYTPSNHESIRREGDFYIIYGDDYVPIANIPFRISCPSGRLKQLPLNPYTS
jgi:hypothetical protein